MKILFDIDVNIGFSLRHFFVDRLYVCPISVYEVSLGFHPSYSKASFDFEVIAEILLQNIENLTVKFPICLLVVPTEDTKNPLLLLWPFQKHPWKSETDNNNRLHNETSLRVWQ